MRTIKLPFLIRSASIETWMLENYKFLMLTVEPDTFKNVTEHLGIDS